MHPAEFIRGEQHISAEFPRLAGVCPKTIRRGSHIEPTEDGQWTPELISDLLQKQAAQQEAPIRQSQDLTEASRQLVDADAFARRELSEMQSRLQQEFATGGASIASGRSWTTNAAKLLLSGTAIC